MDVAFWVECEDCQTRTSFNPHELLCPSCKSDWRFAHYDLADAREALLSRDEHPSSLWHYAAVLPVEDKNHEPDLHAGATPLYRAKQLGLLLGLDQLFIKDERQGPTSSFKDRQAAVSTAVLIEHNLDQAVICSTGNVAMAFSASCARAGIQLWAFITSLVPPEKMHEVAIYGTRVIKVTGTYDEAKKLAHDFAGQRGLYLDRGARSIAAVESMKTIAYEISQQLSKYFPRRTTTGWLEPDWYIQAVSGGLGPIGVLKGFDELREMGLISQTAALGIIQAAGCAPMVEAWKKNAAEATPVLDPLTHITTLTTGDPGRAYSHLNSYMRNQAKGAMESVTDEEAFRALHLVAKLEGLSVEPAAAAAFAGVIKLARIGVFERDEVVVVNCSGHAMPVKPQLLTPGWAHEIDTQQAILPEKPQEGLRSALESLTTRFTTTILVVDDQPDARRLLRRVLESQGAHTVYEAIDGPSALQAMETHAPDLVILDLMMPGMDGFEVLEGLKERSGERDTPIIVVTAKDLSHSEKNRLSEGVEGLFIKGHFIGDDLVDHVDTLLDE